MNVILPEKEKINKKAVALYSISILVCVISIIVLATSENLNGKTIDELIYENTHQTSQDKIDEELLKAEFQNLFQNKLEKSSEIEISDKKIHDEKEIIYTKYKFHETKENRYTVDIDIPYINLDNEFAKKYNQEIEKIFVEKAKNVLQKEEGNAIYSVKYEATREEYVLYLMIYSDLKENTSAQRVIIQTYQYDLEERKEISLGELIDKKQLDRKNIQEKIKKEIKEEQKKVEDLKALGYTIFERNVENDMYKIEFTEEFFVRDGKLYLIYAYGNDNLTSELDVIII